MFTAKDFKHGYPEGPDPQDLADIANEKIQPFLIEFERLQNLCRMQEQHGTEHASKMIKEFEEIFQKHFKDLLA